MVQRVSDERLKDVIEIALSQNLPDTLDLALDLQDARAENVRLDKRVDELWEMQAQMRNQIQQFEVLLQKFTSTSKSIFDFDWSAES